MVFGAYVGLEESPCSARIFLQKNNLLGAQSRFTARARQTGPPGDCGRSNPQKQYRYGHCQRGRRGGGNIDGRRDANSWCYPHGLVACNKAGATAITQAASAIGGRPLQQTFMCDEYSPIGTDDRVEAVIRFVGQNGKRK